MVTAGFARLVQRGIIGIEMELSFVCCPCTGGGDGKGVVADVGNTSVAELVDQHGWRVITPAWPDKFAIIGLDMA